MNNTTSINSTEESNYILQNNTTNIIQLKYETNYILQIIQQICNFFQIINIIL